MDETDTTVETEAGPEQETEQSGLEKLQNITDDEIAAGFERIINQGEGREAAATAEPVEQPAPSVDVSEVWDQALEDHPELEGREEELAELGRTIPGLLEASSEEEALAALDNARLVLEASDQQAELAGVVQQQATDSAIDAIATAEDDIAVVRALDHLADRVPLDSPQFAEALAVAESLAPAGALAFVSMLAQAEEAEQAELVAANEEALQSQAEAIFAAIQSEMESPKAKQALANPEVRARAAEFAELAGTPQTPQEAEQQVRTVIHGAVEADRLDRTNEFLAAFDEAAIGRVPDDSTREALLEEARTQRPTVDASVFDHHPSSQENQQTFLEAFDAHVNRGRDLHEEAQRVAGRALARAAAEKEKK